MRKVNLPEGFKLRISANELANGDLVTISTDKGRIKLGTGYEDPETVARSLVNLTTGNKSVNTRYNTVYQYLSDDEVDMITNSSVIDIYQVPDATITKEYELIK